MRTPRRGRQETKRGTHSSEVELAVPLLDAETPATAALISAAVASSTRSFCEMMQPAASLASSHVLPLPVLSLLLPGANVPVWSASCGSPPSFAISLHCVWVSLDSKSTHGKGKKIHKRSYTDSSIHFERQQMARREY